MYVVNRKSKNSMLKIGNEKTSVFIIDDFLVDTQPAIEYAAKQSFIAGKEHNNLYPGIRTPVDTDYGMTVLNAIAPIFYNVIGVPAHLTLQPKIASYSLLTQDEKDLDLLQCIPHFDNTLTFSYAVLHYLNKGDFGGTGLYRHKPTGYENINAERKQHYIKSAQQHINSNGNPERKYLTHSTDHYELLEVIDYKPNRLVIYPSTLLHSTFIENPAHDVNNNPESGRLTANIFIEFD